MALKPVVASLDEVPEPFRGEYEAHDGKYRLILEGGYVPPAKHTEFRENNVRLLQALGATSVDAALARAALIQGIDPAKLARLKEIDPDKYDALLARTAELEAKGVKGKEDIQALVKQSVEAAIGPVRTELENERKARADAQKRADESLLRETIGQKFVGVGGKSNAVDFIISEAKKVFRVEDGTIKAIEGKLSPKDFLSPISVEEWLTLATKEHDYAFGSSTGGGANGSGNGNGNGPAGPRPGVKQVVLKGDAIERARQLGALRPGKNGVGLVDPVSGQPVEIVEASA